MFKHWPTQFERSNIHLLEYFDSGPKLEDYLRVKQWKILSISTQCVSKSSDFKIGSKAIPVLVVQLKINETKFSKLSKLRRCVSRITFGSKKFWPSKPPDQFTHWIGPVYENNYSAICLWQFFWIFLWLCFWEKNHTDPSTST